MQGGGRKRIVIVGAGFGGLAVALGLRGVDADVTIVDRLNHHLFQPLLYQVATAALSPADIATATRSLLRRRDAEVILAEVTGIDSKQRSIRFRDGGSTPYDYLVLATGSADNFFGHDDWAEHSFALKSLDDALAVRRHLLEVFEKAERCEDPAEVEKLLTLVVVGGGPTGVELSGTIAELCRTTLAHDFKRVDPATARIILCEAGDRLLTSFSAAQSAYAAKVLESLGVELLMNHKIEKIDRGRVRAGGEDIEAATVLWCAGTKPRPAADWLGATAAKDGGVTVLPDCSVKGHPEIFAIGDVAVCLSASGKPLPKLAPVAKQQGGYVAKLLKARLAGKADYRPFRYRDWGSLVVIGRSRAVARFGAVHLTGRIAWLSWALVHLALLVDFRSRILVYVNWTWAWLNGNRGVRLILGTIGDGATVDDKRSCSAANGADR